MNLRLETWSGSASLSQYHLMGNHTKETIMSFSEPTGYVECDYCGDTEQVDMTPVADGSGGFDCWLYDKDELPEGWVDIDGAQYCGLCAP